MEQEIWKPIKNYEGLYEISNYGNVKSLPKKIGGRYISQTKIMKPQLINGNRLQVKLVKNNVSKNYRVHRLVAEAFIPNPNNLPQVNHKDENPQNNRFDNLEWCTSYYNLHYGTRIERCRENNKIPVVSYDKNGKVEIYNSLTEAQEKNQISRSAIIKCCKGKQKTCLHKKWFYLKDVKDKICNERDDLQQRVDKAIEYINNNSLYEQESDYDNEDNLILGIPSDEKATNDLLNILKGNDNPSFEEMVNFLENTCKDLKNQPTLHEKLEEKRKRIAKIVDDFKGND